jgi:hypothetical protein
MQDAMQQMVDESLAAVAALLATGPVEQGPNGADVARPWC